MGTAATNKEKLMKCSITDQPLSPGRNARIVAVRPSEANTVAFVSLGANLDEQPAERINELFNVEDYTAITQWRIVWNPPNIGKFETINGVNCLSVDGESIPFPRNVKSFDEVREPFQRIKEFTTPRALRGTAAG